jgi:hypothetical protein
LISHIGIVTERLGLDETVSTAGGERRGELEDVACILLDLRKQDYRETMIAESREKILS